MTTPINWSWLASEDPSQEAGEFTISCRSHRLSFEMESFNKAGKLIRIIEGLCARSREECISQIMGTMYDGIGKIRNEL